MPHSEKFNLKKGYVLPASRIDSIAFEARKRHFELPPFKKDES